MHENQLPPVNVDALERMQAGVMGRISAAERARQQRRAVLGGGAALVLAATIVGSLATGGIGGGQDLAEAPASGTPEPYRSHADAGTDASSLGMLGGASVEDFGMASSPGDAPAADAKSDRQVIVNGWASVVVSDVAEAVTALGALAEDSGGHVQSRSQAGEGMDAQGSITVRIPAGTVHAFVEALRELGSVQQVRLGEDDVTLQVTDLESRISSLRASVTRLEQLMQDAASVSELLEAETQLSIRQSELESLLSQQAYLAENVALATLTVELTAKAVPVAIEPEGFEGGLLAGWNALVSFFGVILVGLGVIAPWLGVLAILAGLVWLVVRLRRRTGSTAQGSEVPPAPPLPSAD